MVLAHDKEWNFRHLFVEKVDSAVLLDHDHERELPEPLLVLCPHLDPPESGSGNAKVCHESIGTYATNAKFTCKLFPK